MLPTLRGLVRRRVLVNFRVDPAVIERELPATFRPKLLGNWAVAGICLIRVEQLRPEGTPAALGRASENAAHRIAVTWTDNTGMAREGVYIPRRDTGALLNYLVGGRLFPGEHQHSHWFVRESVNSLDLALTTDDGTTDLSLRAHTAPDFPRTSHFASLAHAVEFFASGVDGYSATRLGGHLDGLRMQATTWPMQALTVESLHSAYFDNQSIFPPGSVQFDSALIMRDVEYKWQPLPERPWMPQQ